MNREEASAAVDRMIAGEIDILIGTQMAAKGHHFPNLTLVAVIDADLGLNGGDLRAAERTFQLLYQVAGRAGREDRPGRALVQTHMPEHPVMQALVSGDRDRELIVELATVDTANVDSDDAIVRTLELTISPTNDAATQRWSFGDNLDAPPRELELTRTETGALPPTTKPPAPTPAPPDGAPAPAPAPAPAAPPAP